MFSAYRPPAFGVGGFSDKFNSLHTYGLAVDMQGIGRPGSPEAVAAEQEAAHARPALRAIDGRTMLAAGHARVVFSVIPQLPPEAVAWPRRHPTYADIPVPRSEGELMLRAEELARVVWRVAAGDERRDEPLRRTLAFYEAGSRLSVRGGFRAA